MPYLPQPRPSRRAPRTSLRNPLPAVLRSRDGRRVPAKLQVISISGGLLCLSKPLDQGSVVKLMFLTSSGSILGAAEMLSPISWHLQPFKFVRLYDDDQERLESAIQTSLDRNRSDRVRMERFRAW